MRSTLMLAALLAVGCGGPAAPSSAPSDLGARRQPLYHVGVIFHHQVALELPSRADVLIGQVRFSEAESYRLHAQTPFGLDLFELGYAKGIPEAQITADALKGAFPAEALAELIAWIYLKGCPEDAPHAPMTTGPVARCGALTERLDPETLAVSSRLIVEGERRVEIRYEGYKSFEGLWLAEKIMLTAGDSRVEIHLSGVDREAMLPEQK